MPALSIRTQQQTIRPALWVALGLSCLAHGMAWLLLPAHMEGMTPAKAVQYDATLVEAESARVATTGPAPRATSAQTQAPRARVAPRLAPSAPSEAGFAAPEGSLALPPPSVGEVASAQSGASDSAAPLPAAANVAASGVPDNLPSPALNADDAARLIAAAEAPKRRAPAFAERISIEYKMSMALSDGVANYRWIRRGTQYEIESSIQATGFIVGAIAGVLHQQSRGEITDEGLRPESFSIRRGEGDAETASFLRTASTLQLKRRSDTRAVPLTRDMQDMQSFLFQLAYDAPHLGQTGDKIDVVVTNARKVYRYQFQYMGNEPVETRFGTLDTIRLLSQAANPEDSYEVWLAPAHYYLPVRLKYFLGRFPVEQVAIRLGTSGEAGSR